MNDLTIYSAEELKAIQKLELDALKELIKICDECNIEYFLIGGTTLGAVRHGGFIPWDDDIDIGMTRENYIKFLKLAPDKLPEDYYLQTPYNNKNNPYFYSKVRINNTIFMEYCNRNLDIHHGVYVDVFPVDEVPDDELENIKHFNRVQKWIRIFTLRQVPDVSKKPETLFEKVKVIIRKPLHWLFKLIPWSFVIKKTDNAITQYNGTGQACYCGLNYPIRKKVIINKEDLFPLKNHVFEDIVAKVPNNSEVYLTTQYGDYMQLPPEEKRFGHKPYKINLKE